MGGCAWCFYRPRQPCSKVLWPRLSVNAVNHPEPIFAHFQLAVAVSVSTARVPQHCLCGPLTSSGEHQTSFRRELNSDILIDIHTYLHYLLINIYIYIFFSLFGLSRKKVPLWPDLLIGTYYIGMQVNHFIQGGKKM